MGTEPGDPDDLDGNDEPALRAAVLRGDGAAWEILYERARGPVRRWLGRRLPGAEVDDAVQEAWMVAVKRIGSFDPRVGTFTGWVLGIAAKTALSARRRAVRDGAGRVVVEHGDSKGRDGLAAGGGAGTDAGDESDLVQETLRALPPRYRTVLQAKYEQGLRVEEIAKLCGATAKTIESLLTRAREAFRALYRPTES